MIYELSSLELQDHLQEIETIPHRKCQVFPSDNIPNNTENRRFFIINTDGISSPGSHWVSIFLPENSEAEFFDSLGRCPSYYSQFILDFLIEHSPRGFIYNYKRLQPPNSSTCGLYCLYFLYYRTKNISFQEILKYFEDILENNDKKVIKLYKNILKTSRKGYKFNHLSKDEIKYEL